MVEEDPMVPLNSLVMEYQKLQLHNLVMEYHKLQLHNPVMECHKQIDQAMVSVNLLSAMSFLVNLTIK